MTGQPESKTRIRLWSLLCLAGGLAIGVARATPGAAGTYQAAAALRDLDQAYVEAWKQPDTARQEAALLPLFAEDAVIMPGGGAEPREGHTEFREFWFPEGAPPTNVRSFEHVVHGVDVQDGLGVIHGRSRLAFEYDGRDVTQEGSYLITAREQPGGEWRISRMIWNNRIVPPEAGGEAS